MTHFHRSGATMICEAKNCPKQMQFPTHGKVIGFLEGTDEARAAGWKVWQKYGNWRHLCPVHIHLFNELTGFLSE